MLWPCVANPRLPELKRGVVASERHTPTLTMKEQENTPEGMMGDGMDTPEHKPMSGGEWCVPVTALQMPGEDEQMTTPGVGDKVQFQAEGTLTRIEGDNAYIKPEAANGKPLSTEAAATKDNTEPEAEYASLRGEAEQQGMM